MHTDITFIANTALDGRTGNYADITVDVEATLKSWRESLFSFEWLDEEGRIKSQEELPEREQPKRAGVEEKLEAGIAIEKPLLGIGIHDNVEIGIGRPEFLTLAAHGVKTIPVHVLKSNESDFKPFLAALD